MELIYDKVAIQEYMDDIEDVGESLRRVKDESLSAYNSCKQYYSRLYTELEEANRKAYNMLEYAESLQRSAETQTDFALRMINNAQEDSEIRVAQEQLSHAQAIQAQATQEMAVASEAYEKAQANMQKLTNVWEQYHPSINTALDQVENGFSSFNTLVSNGNRDLKDYMMVLDMAQVALYSESNPASSGGTSFAKSSVTSYSDSVSSAKASTVTSSNVNSASSSKVSSNISYGISAASTNIAAHSPSSVNESNIDSVSHTFKSEKKNTLAVLSSAGVASIVMTIANKSYNFPNTKSGAAKAYREALKSGDDEMIAQTDLMFKSFDSRSLKTAPNQKYVSDTLSELKKDLPNIFDKEMVIAGSQKRKLYEPHLKTSAGESKGTWKGNVYFLDDTFIPSKKYNESGQTISQIKQDLFDKYRIDVGGIPFENGVADFSGISVATIPTMDIVTKSTGITPVDYALLSQKERAALFESVFGGVADGKEKRKKNFDYADQIAAEKQISIPGLPCGYTSKDLKTWREDNKFSWDEQVNGGYNLIPSVIHASVAHTGMVGVSRNANNYLSNQENSINEDPQKYSFDEENAPISIDELLNT